MASRADFLAVGRNSYANARPAAEEDRWYYHRRMSFRVDHPGVLMVAVDVGQMAVSRQPLATADSPFESELGDVTGAILATPDGVWLANIERTVEEVSAGDPVVVGPGGGRESLEEHYRRIGMYGTADAVDPGDPVVYMRRYIHGRMGREEPHAASLVHALAGPDSTPPFDPPPSARWKIIQGMANQLGKAHLGSHSIELNVEAPVRPEDHGTTPVPAEELRGTQLMEPTEERVSRWDFERRTNLKDMGVEPGAPRLGPAVLAYEEGIPQGGASTLYSDVRYNLFRYLGTKADPRPVRTMEFSRVAELGALLTTVSPTPAAVLVVSRDPYEGYLTAKDALPSVAVQAMAASTLASRPVHGGTEGDAGYFNTVLWLATALEREAGRLPWTIHQENGAEIYVGLSRLGRAHDEDSYGDLRGLVSAVDVRAGGRLPIGGVVDLSRGRFEGEGVAKALRSAIGPLVEANGPPASMVVHREGSHPKAEREDTEALIPGMVADGLLADEVRVSFVELNLKHPFRLFQEGLKGPATCRAGSYAVLDERTALLATTGYPVKTRGTPEVLMVTARSDQAPGDAARDAHNLGALDWGGR
jgi:hypothetical protein